MAKIAVDSIRQSPTARQIAAGRGWTISEIDCTAGPHDTPFEEQHSTVSIAVVVSGTFQYRTATGSGLMTPGSLLLGNAGDCFCCAHEHGVGDRCVAFSYDAERWERVVSGAGVRHGRFRAARIPPVRELAAVVAQALALRAGDGSVAAEELSVGLAAGALQLGSVAVRGQSIGAERAALSRVSRVARMLENEPGGSHGLDSLAQMARLSPYHFLRVFQAVTGTTPHQYLLRLRLQRSAVRLRTESSSILEIALDCGFGEASHFHRAFRSEFGISPRAYRKAAVGPLGSGTYRKGSTASNGKYCRGE